MSLINCLPGLVAEGKLSQEQADRAAEIYGRRERFHRRVMDPAAAASAAGEDTVRAMEVQAQRRKRLELKQLAAKRRIVADMAKYRGDSPGAAAVALLARDELAPYANVEYRWKQVRADAHAMIDGLLLKHRRNLIGEVRHAADLDDLVDEAFGVASGNLSAKEYLDSFRAAADMLRQRFNAAGGHIGRLEGWFPQSHDSVAIAEAGETAWKADASDLFDRGRMIDRESGLPFDEEKWDGFLGDLYATLSTDGWADREPGAKGGKMLANQRADHRVIFFKGGQAWRTYQAKYGGGNAFDAMMSHIDGMSRDIALMEILGPNPAATVQWLQDAVEKEARLKGGRGDRRLLGIREGRLAIDQSRMDRNMIQRLFNEVMGKHREPNSRGLALAFSALRSWQVATKLGSAVLSTTSDQATQVLTRRFNGLPIVKMALTQAKMLNPLDGADRAFAIRSGLIAEEAAQVAGGNARYVGQQLTGELSRRMADAVLRVSGLSAVTQGGRWAFGMDFLSALTDYSVRSWDKLDPPFRDMFGRYGLGEPEWNKVRGTALEEERGAPWIMLKNVEDEEVRRRLHEMILTETDFAVPVPGLRIQAAINAAAKKGTWPGELLRTWLQFKSFPATVLFMQADRFMALRPWNAARYAAAMTVLMTGAGALTVWMKDVAKGRDPRRSDDPKFLIEAFAQGGGGGIYGDFLRSAESRSGFGIDDTLKGPAWQTATALESLTVDPLLDVAVKGKDPQLGKRLVKVARSETPGGSLWYMRLAYERLMLDTMQEMADPRAAQSFRTIERRAEKDYGQDFWWAPGEHAPARAPDFSHVGDSAPPR